MEGMAETIPPLNRLPKFIPPSSLQQSNPPKFFPTLLDSPSASPKARIFCEILVRSPVHAVEAALATSGVLSEPEIVEEVLKLSYGYAQAAVKFFRWAGLNHKHSPHAWNLMVDLLGKNKLFEPMWDAIRSMKKENVLTVATFVSIFESYCSAGRFSEATMTFDVMEKYSIEQDIVAVNSLLSAICREDNQTSRALEFFEKMKVKIPPDADTFAILLEGWEKEGNAAEAMRTFGEMVIRVGWSPQNTAAYNAFLSTLIQASQPDEALKFLQLMQKQNCFPGLKFFSDALDILINKNDSIHAVSLWQILVESGLAPNLKMYNAMIRLLCNKNEIDNAFKLLDEMALNGAFPDSVTYNIIFSCLIKNKKVQKTGKFFYEMIKNESPPTCSNCAAAITMLFDGYDPEVGIEIWNYVIENRISPFVESANALLIGLCNLGRLSEVRRYAEEMMDRRILIAESTMSILDTAFTKKGRSAGDTFKALRRRWKSSAS